MTGTLETTDGRPTLRFERRLDHPIERVWRAITEPGELARWFVAPVEWIPKAGEVFEAESQSGEIEAVEAPRLFEYSWGGERFRFELSPEGKGCLLIFTHVFDDRALGAQHAAGWETYLMRLDHDLAGEQLSVEEAHRTFPELHERYVERFGLDPEVGRRRLPSLRGVTLDEGPQLRLERRYEHGIERVWRALTEADELRHWFPPGEQLQVTHSEPPHQLAGNWYGDELRFELRSDGGGCVLVFTHAFAEPEKAARDAAGWDRCFVRFEALLRGEPMSEEESLDGWPEVHERYAAEFGVDPELGRQAFAEHASRR